MMNLATAYVEECNAVIPDLLLCSDSELYFVVIPRSTSDEESASSCHGVREENPCYPRRPGPPHEESHVLSDGV
jgi:hypothetical protein